MLLFRYGGVVPGPDASFAARLLRALHRGRGAVYQQRRSCLARCWWLISLEGQYGDMPVKRANGKTDAILALF